MVRSLWDSETLTVRVNLTIRFRDVISIRQRHLTRPVHPHPPPPSPPVSFFQAQLKEHRLWTICAASGVLASGATGAVYLKPAEKLIVMETDSGRRGWCLQLRRMSVGTELSRFLADVPTVSLRDWQDLAFQLLHVLLSRVDVHRQHRWDHNGWSTRFNSNYLVFSVRYTSLLMDWTSCFWPVWFTCALIQQDLPKKKKKIEIYSNNISVGYILSFWVHWVFIHPMTTNLGYLSFWMWFSWRTFALTNGQMDVSNEVACQCIDPYYPLKRTLISRTFMEVHEVHIHDRGQ